MAVLAVTPVMQFFDDNGNVLAGGKIYTYAAGTTAPKTAYLDADEVAEATNPIILDAFGRTVFFVNGAYKYELYDSADNLIRTVDDVESFTTTGEAASAFFQSFSGDGSTSSFTLSADLGTEEKNLMVFVDSGLENYVTNGTFATDTDWTKGSGWVIGSGVATATAASSDIDQDAGITLAAGTAYTVVYTITRSAGTLTPKIGGQSGTTQNAAGTYREVIVAGSSQKIAFEGAGFSGTLDNVSVTVAAEAGYNILSPSDFTISGTSLAFGTTPAAGTNNIYVFAPSLLAASASASADAAAASEAAAAESANSAAGYAARNKWEYDTTTTMADPGTGKIRFNSATPGSASAIAISDLSDNTSNPDVGAWLDTFGDGDGGILEIFKDESNFLRFTVTADIDNTSWHQLTVTNILSVGTITNTNELYIGFVKSGVTTVAGGITALTGDVTAAGSGSVATTLANSGVTVR